MKDAAKRDTRCGSREPASHPIFERTLRPRHPRGHARPSVVPIDPSPSPAEGAALGPVAAPRGVARRAADAPAASGPPPPAPAEGPQRPPPPPRALPPGRPPPADAEREPRTRRPREAPRREGTRGTGPTPPERRKGGAPPRTTKPTRPTSDRTPSPAGLKHIIKRRKRKPTRIPPVAASEAGGAQAPNPGAGRRPNCSLAGRRSWGPPHRQPPEIPWDGVPRRVRAPCGRRRGVPAVPARGPDVGGPQSRTARECSPKRVVSPTQG